MFKFTYLILLTLLFESIITHSQNNITVSPIGPQEVIAGGKIPIFFSAVNGLPNGVVFSAENLPDFVVLTTEQDTGNAGRFIVNSKEGDEGTYDFSLLVNTNNGKSASIRIHLTVLPILGKKYYCDPINGNINNNGDYNHPWSTLQEVFSSNKKFKDGDVIFLRNGYHGTPNIKGYGTTNQYIVAQTNHNPEVSRFTFGSCSHWNVSGLTISPEVIGKTSLDRLVEFRTSALFNSIQNCEIYGIKNSVVWDTNQKWYDNCPYGIWCDGKNSLIKNNYLYNTDFAVHVNSKYSKFLYNTIDRYASDAIRGLADDTEYSYNVIKNPVVDDYQTGNHDDAFQSWTTAFGPPKKNIIIKGNQIFSATYLGIPLLSSVMQGVINFDGFSDNWEISNNLIVQDHWHGITLLGAKNCKIVNNTVIKNPLNVFQFGNPWIGVWPTKESAGNIPSVGNLIRNNIVATYSKKNDEPGSFDHNLISSNYSDIFMDYIGWDFRLKSAQAIDKGNPKNAPNIDIEGRRRNIGNPDLGCYEKDATLIDFDNPIGTIIGKGEATSPTSIKLNWNSIQDSNGIDYYTIIYDNKAKQISTNQLHATINGLRPNTTYSFSITAYDFFGHASLPSQSFDVTTKKNAETMDVYFIPGAKYDQQIKSNQKLMWVGMPEINIGGAYAINDASAVFPFKLPLLDINYKIYSADFILDYVGKENNPSSLDLYGIQFRKKSDVLKSDHWQGKFKDDDMATPIEKNYISSDKLPGTIHLSSDGKTKLASFLENNIHDGAKATNFIFMRINSSVINENDKAFFTVTSADSPNASLRPILKVITSPPNSISPVYIDNGITISPNPVQKGFLNFQCNGFNIGKPVKITIHNAYGQQVFKDQYTINSKKQNITINSNFSTGIYFLTVLGINQYSESKFELF